MRHLRAPAATAALLAALVLAPPAVRAAVLPPDFVAEDAAPGAGFEVPVCIAFMPDGRMMVGEKQGRVWVVKNGVKHTAPMWQRQAEVLDEADRGLLGMAVDPNYASNRYVYFLYTVDPDSNGVDDGSDGFGRLVRYQTSLADSNVVDPATRTILMGTGWRDAPIIGSPSHTVGALRWGTDGSLFVTTGDGAQFNQLDPGGLDPQMFGPQKADPYEDIGAYRSQNLWSLAGKLLRLNPANGHGYPTNPFWDGDSKSVRSRIWAYGLRNPFRFTVKPGSGSADPGDGQPGIVYLGDVGWTEWEEANVTTGQGGDNFGWPCYEGFGIHFTYNTTTPDHGGCDSLGGYWNPNAPKPPLMSWHHANEAISIPPGFKGNASVGGAFYTGSQYPSMYRNRYFFADYGQSFIKVAVTDSLDQLVTVLDFATEANGPVELVADPVSGDLHYVSIFDFAVYRIRYTGGQPGNNAPVAVASGAPTFGTPPLEVSFSSAGSFDLDGDPLDFSWTFGDGFGASGPSPVHTYQAFGVYDAVLTVTDGQGGLARDTVRIVATGEASFPTTPVLDAFNRPDGPIGGAWVDLTSGLSIVDSALVQGSGVPYNTTTHASGPYGPTQEAYFTIASLAPSAPEYSLLLKLQTTSGSSPHLEVRYDASVGQLYVTTFTPGPGYETRAALPLALASGDRLGVRAYDDARVHVFRNNALIAEASVAGWPYAANGGHIGMAFGLAHPARMDDFGGGTTAFNTPPVAGIAGAADSSFYALGDTIVLVGVKSDAEDAPAALAGHFRLFLIHNNHFHIEADVSGDTAVMVPVDHEDGTGVYYEARYWVTDSGGLRDTATIRVFPETDLEPVALSVWPPAPSIYTPATWTFQIANHGRMPTRRTTWRLVSGGATLAEGDTAVAALDTITVSVEVPPTLAVGAHDVRLALDSLGVMVETDEANNAANLAITVVDGPLAAGDAPLRLALSAPRPNPARGAVRFELDLPRAAGVRFEVFDVTGRRVWSQGERAFEAGRHALAWDGRAGAESGAGRAGPGLYFARVAVEGAEPFVRRIVRIE